MGSRVAGRERSATMTELLKEIDKESRESIRPVANQRNGRSVDSMPEVPPASKSYRRPMKFAWIFLAILVAAIVGLRYYLYARAHESTDDAFIAGHITAISPKVASYVSHVYIDDNQHVKRGDLLVELDARDQARLAQARANLAAAVARHRSAVINVRVIDTT